LPRAPDGAGPPTRADRGTGDRADQASPRCVRRCAPAPCLPTGLDDDRAATAHGDATRGSRRVAEPGSGRLRQGLGLSPNRSLDAVPGPRPYELPRAPGPSGVPPVAPGESRRTNLPASGGGSGPKGRDASEPQDQGPAESTRPVEARRPTQA